MYKNRNKLRPLSVHPPQHNGLDDFQSNVIVNVDKIKGYVSNLSESTTNSNVVLHDIDLTLDNINSTITTINGKLPTTGQKTMSGSRPVVLASNHSSIPVTVSDVSTATNQSTMINTLNDIDGKLRSGNDDTINGNALQVLNYGRIDNATQDLKAMKCSNDGTLYVYDASVDANTTQLTNINNKLTKSTVITANGVESLQQVQICASNDTTNLRTLQCTDEGKLVVEDHTQFNSTQILASTVINAGNNVDVDIDLGDLIHPPQSITLFIKNASSLKCALTLYLSYDGSDWFPSAGNVTLNHTSKVAVGVFTDFKAPLTRYYRLNIENTEASASGSFSAYMGLYQ